MANGDKIVLGTLFCSQLFDGSYCDLGDSEADFFSSMPALETVLLKMCSLSVFPWQLKELYQRQQVTTLDMQGNDFFFELPDVVRDDRQLPAHGAVNVNQTGRGK